MKMPPLRSSQQRPATAGTCAKSQQQRISGRRRRGPVRQCALVIENQSESSAEHKRQLSDRLRREILAARLKVTLDEQLNRETSDIVNALASMKLPRVARVYGSDIIRPKCPVSTYPPVDT